MRKRRNLFHLMQKVLFFFISRLSKCLILSKSAYHKQVYDEYQG